MPRPVPLVVRALFACAAGCIGPVTSTSSDGGVRPDGGGDQEEPIVCGLAPPGPGAIDPRPQPARPRPFFPPGNVDLGRADALLADYTDAEWLALVPRQSPRGGARCPVSGQEGSAFTWSPAAPDRITCAGGTVTLDYQRPPQRVDVAVLSGRTVSLPAWPMPGGGLSFVGSRIDFEKSMFMDRNLDLLGAAYTRTGDEKYARRVALALDAWADRVPDYYLTGINSEAPLSPDQAAARGWLVQRASDHNGLGHELSWFPVAALDRIYDSQALVQLSALRGYDVREHIVRDLYLDETDYLTQTVPMARHTSTNLSFSYEVMGQLATVLGRRGGLIEWLDEYMARTVLNFMRDGMDGESFGYQRTYAVSNSKVINNMTGYFDVWPPASADEVAIRDHIARSRAIVQESLDAMVRVALPDGQLPPFGDTGLDAEPTGRDATTSQLLPAYGHVVLGSGTDGNQTQVNLGFEDNANHVHEDVLGLVLYAFERELLGDIRYSRVPGRTFTQSTMAHTTVTVNRQRQIRTNDVGGDNSGHLFTSGNLVTYEPGLDGIAIAEVDGARAYPGLVSRYQRTLILNAIDPARPYVLDLFRVTGGGTHDYFFHGSTRFDQTATTTLDLTPVDSAYPLLAAGARWTEPTPDNQNPSGNDWYGAFRDMRRGRASGPWTVTFQEAGGSRGTHLHMVDVGGSEVWLGRSPAPYRDRNPQGFYDHWRPSLLVRREGSDLDSAFVGVIEPFAGEGGIAGVELLPLVAADPDRFAIHVRFSDGRDDVLLIDSDAAGGGEPVATADGSYRLDGRFGVVSRAGGAERAILVAGTRLEHGGQVLTMEHASLDGIIAGVIRQVDGCTANAFVTDAELPAGTALRGRWVRLTFDRYAVIPDGTRYPLGIREQRGITQMYAIDRVQRQDGKSYIVLADDPMLSMRDGEVIETTRPLRTFDGPVAFSIALGTSGR